MEESRTPGFFSPLRWSPGSIIIVLIISVINILLILGSMFYKSKLLFYVFFIGLAVEIFIIIIKGFEHVEIMENESKSIINRTGITEKDISPGIDGVVKIDNQLWSARSDQIIKKGEYVIVEKQEGLFLIVRKKE